MTIRPWVAALLLVGCSSGGGASDAVWIAVGADVPVQVGLIDPRATSITDVTIDSGNFTVGTPQLDIQMVTVPVHASRPGDGRLVIHYIDDRGAARTKQVLVRAAEVTRTLVEVQCSSYVDGRTTYSFSAGAQFTFIAQAFAGDQALLSGTLELVQPNGFVIMAPTGQDREQRGAVAPSLTGAYTWQLAGGNTADFVVYDATTLGLTMEGYKDSIDRTTFLTLRLGAGGAPVCVHDHDDRITITVTSGGCRPAMSGAEVDGPMPVNARDGDPSFELVGSGACTVEARTDGGSATTSTWDVEPTIFRPAGSSGTALTPAGVQIGTDPPVAGSCGDALTDGNCDGKPDPVPLSDPDCFINSNWSISHYDVATGKDERLAAGDLVGVGLTTVLHLDVVAYTALIPVGPPKNMQAIVTPAGSLQVTDLGCNSLFQHLGLVAQAAGQPGLELHADNLDDVGSFSMQARAIARTVFETGDLEHDDLATPDAIVDYFIHSRASVGVHYEAADGTILRGYAPLLVSSDATDTGALLGMTAAYPYLFTGNAPHTITVASPRIGSMQALRVRDAGAIAGIGGAFADTTVARGQTRCIDMYPTESGGRRIFGLPPFRPVLTFTGGALVMGQNAGCRYGVALQAFATGTTGVAFAWGAGSSAHTWTVTGP